MESKAFKVIGWIVSLIITIIGTFGVTSAVYNNQIEQTINSGDNSTITVNIGGESITLNPENAQNIYSELEQKIITADSLLEELQTKVDGLESENTALEIENRKYQNYGTEALVSIDKDYDSDKVSLFAFDPVNSSSWTVNEGSLKDSLNNDYSVNLPYIIASSSSYAEYYTNGKFSKITGKVVPHKSHGDEASAQMRIYADDMLVYSSADITRKTECFEFDVDISGAKFIRISFDVSPSYGSSRLLVMDTTLIK